MGLDGAKLVPERVIGGIILEGGLHVADGILILPLDHAEHAKDDKRLRFIRDDFSGACG